MHDNPFGRIILAYSSLVLLACALGCNRDVDAGAYQYECKNDDECGADHVCRTVPGYDFDACYRVGEEPGDASIFDADTSDADTSASDADASISDADTSASDADPSDADADTSASDADASISDADTSASDADPSDADADTSASDADASISDADTDTSASDADTSLSDADTSASDADTADTDTNDVDATPPGDCGNGMLDGDETDIDCGGSCTQCADGLNCDIDADCASGLCWRGVCAEGSCSDYTDNDSDGLVDCEDPHCHMGGHCSEFNCSNNVDDDQDGFIDCDDADCAGAPTCSHIIFATQELYDGDLGGPDGADFKCNRAARQAGYSGQWKAVVSTDTEDLTDRIEIDGPIYNTAGDRIADDQSQFCGGTIQNAVAVDQFGDTISSSDVHVWTGTQDDCSTRCSFGCCDDWTSNAGQNQSTTDTQAGTGLVGSDVSMLEGSGGLFCDSSARLYCISGQTVEHCGDGQDNDGDGLVDCDDPACEGRRECAHRVFVSSQSFKGDLGGLAGADDECMQLAQQVGLFGRWRAILSSSQVDAKDHILIDKPVYNLRRERIADDEQSFWNAATTSLANAIKYDERIEYDSSASTEVWTGTQSDGSVSASDHCSDWTVAQSSSTGQAGLLNFTNGWWTEATSHSCDTDLRIYCIDGQ